jgi:dihydrofolate reductase
MEAIYAVDIKNGLSKNGVIPWKSKKDITFFMNKTKNNIVIMGKNTYFSIPEEHRPLKNRLNIVLTKTLDLEMESSNVLFTNNDHIYEDILNQKNKYYETYNYLKKD